MVIAAVACAAWVLRRRGPNNQVPHGFGRTSPVLGSELPTLAGSITSGSGTAMVRPESVTVTADESGAATVRSVAFLGPISRVYVDELSDGAVVHAQLSSSQAREFSPGQRVAVGVQPTDVLVVPVRAE